jgi:glycine oxidase
MNTAAVVGAGIMGSLLALGLHQEGWQVTLFEAEAQLQNCSNAAAGLLAPMSELDKAEPVIFHLGMESIAALWPAIIQQLSLPIYFQQKGSLVVHHPQDATEWQHFSARIISKLTSVMDENPCISSPLPNPLPQVGEGANSGYLSLQQQALLRLEPELGQFKEAYYFPQEGQLDNQALLPILRKHLQALGISWKIATVHSLMPGQVIVDNKSHDFDMVFDCRGLKAKNMLPGLRGLRGELIWLHAPDVQLQRPVRLLHPRYPIYIAPRPDSTYLIGASELETEDISAISVRTTLELLTAAYYVHRGFAEARVIKTVTHCRPTFIHHQPRIYYSEGLLAVNGLYRHGYLIAPALVAEILRGLKSKQSDLRYPELWESFL